MTTIWILELCIKDSVAAPVFLMHRFIAVDDGNGKGGGRGGGGGVKELDTKEGGQLPPKAQPVL